MAPAPKDTMARLWAPWRTAYIRQARRERSAVCIFCRAIRGRGAKPDYVVARRGTAFALLNSFPYNVGHLMVCPVRHVGDFTALTEAEVGDVFALVQTMMRRLDTLLHPGGYNVGVNVGRAAGAGIPGHLHVHLVPRWLGDTNFMPVIGQTKILSQSLQALHGQLRAQGGALNGSARRRTAMPRGRRR